MTSIAYMRKLVVTEYIPVDWVFEEPGEWSFEYWNEEAMKYKYEELFSSELQLLGRITYEGFAKAWRGIWRVNEEYA